MRMTPSPSASRGVTHRRVAGLRGPRSVATNAAELDRACVLLRDSACPVLTPGMLVSARGRRPLEGA